MTASGAFELAIVAVLRNEAAYVEEWIAYHSVLGVEHFYLYENRSDDDIRNVLARYIAHGLVTLIDFPIGGAQVPAYSHAVHCFAGSTQWLAPLDLDEFIVPKVDNDIPAMLRRLGDADRVVLPWRNFGMSGHRTSPPGLVIENYVLAEDIPHGGFAEMPVKSIARAGAIVAVGVHTQGVSGRTVDASGAPAEMRYVTLVEPRYDERADQPLRDQVRGGVRRQDRPRRSQPRQRRGATTGSTRSEASPHPTARSSASSSRPGGDWPSTARFRRRRTATAARSACAYRTATGSATT